MFALHQEQNWPDAPQNSEDQVSLQLQDLQLDSTQEEKNWYHTEPLEGPGVRKPRRPQNHTHRNSRENDTSSKTQRTEAVAPYDKNRMQGVSASHRNPEERFIFIIYKNMWVHAGEPASKEPEDPVKGTRHHHVYSGRKIPENRADPGSMNQETP